MKLIFAVMFCIAVTACSDHSPTATVSPADTAHGPGLLLPWNALSGRIAYATNAQIILIDANQRVVRTLYTPLADETVNDVGMSADGKRVGISSLLNKGGTRITILDSATGAVITSRPNETCARWLADGRLSTIAGTSILVDGVKLLDLGALPASCPSWHVSGRWFAIALYTPDARGTEIHHIEIPNGTHWVLLTSQPGDSVLWYDPAVSPNGQTLAIVAARTAGPDNNIFVATTSLPIDGSSVTVVNPPGRTLKPGLRLFGLSWSTDNARLLGVSTSSSGGSYDQAGLFIVDANSGVAQKLVSHPVYAAAWSN